MPSSAAAGQVLGCIPAIDQDLCSTADTDLQDCQAVGYALEALSGPLALFTVDPDACILRTRAPLKDARFDKPIAEVRLIARNRRIFMEDFGEAKVAIWLINDTKSADVRGSKKCSLGNMKTYSEVLFLGLANKVKVNICLARKGEMDLTVNLRCPLGNGLPQGIARYHDKENVGSNLVFRENQLWSTQVTEKQAVVQIKKLHVKATGNTKENKLTLLFYCYVNFTGVAPKNAVFTEALIKTDFGEANVSKKWTGQEHFLSHKLLHDRIYLEDSTKVIYANVDPMFEFRLLLTKAAKYVTKTVKFSIIYGLPTTGAVDNLSTQIVRIISEFPSDFSGNSLQLRFESPLFHQGLFMSHFFYVACTRPVTNAEFGNPKRVLGHGSITILLGKLNVSANDSLKGECEWKAYLTVNQSSSCGEPIKLFMLGKNHPLVGETTFNVQCSDQVSIVDGPTKISITGPEHVPLNDTAIFTIEVTNISSPDANYTLSCESDPELPMALNPSYPEGSIFAYPNPYFSRDLCDPRLLLGRIVIPSMPEETKDVIFIDYQLNLLGGQAKTPIHAGQPLIVAVRAILPGKSATFLNLSISVWPASGMTLSMPFSDVSSEALISHHANMQCSRIINTANSATAIFTPGVLLNPSSGREWIIFNVILRPTLASARVPKSQPINIDIDAAESGQQPYSVSRKIWLQREGHFSFNYTSSKPDLELTPKCVFPISLLNGEIKQFSYELRIDVYAYIDWLSIAVETDPHDFHEEPITLLTLHTQRGGNLVGLEPESSEANAFSRLDTFQTSALEQVIGPVANFGYYYKRGLVPPPNADIIQIDIEVQGSYSNPNISGSTVGATLTVNADGVLIQKKISFLLTPSASDDLRVNTRANVDKHTDEHGEKSIMCKIEAELAETSKKQCQQMNLWLLHGELLNFTANALANSYSIEQKERGIIGRGVTLLAVS
ncbi:unnamed protein product [Dibothriocephalus latus]|uniref:Uncharacterized protein n=1 Tax=Dibothriocephalus latus TaxID=60516 RepID=A0A3P6SIJ7_DIBLA|nr:unnamed protein product [Dibothriocephalus latus]